MPTGAVLHAREPPARTGAGPRVDGAGPRPQGGDMANMVGRARRTADGPAGEKLAGPLHAVPEAVGRPAVESHEEVPALCGQPVQVVPVEDVPDDVGLCRVCQYGA